MSQYQAIKAATNAYIKTNGRQEITGAILNAVMIATIDSLGKFYQFVGRAEPDTDPGVIDQNIAYLAGTPGTYEHLGGFTLDAGELAVIKFDGEWHKEAVATIPALVSQLQNDLGFITNAVSDLVNYYTKGETFTKSEVQGILLNYYDRDEVDSIVSVLTRQSYVVAWDGTAEPVVGDIPAGVSVTWGGNPYVGTLPASASTIGRIYLVSNGAGYDEYITTEDGGYSWISIGTTSIDLSDYATKAEVSQLEAKVNDNFALPIATSSGYYNTNVSSGGTHSSSSTVQGVYMPCSPGDVFVIYGVAASSNYYRLYALYNSSQERVDRFANSGDYRTSPYVLTIPEGVAYVAINLSSYDATTDKILKRTSLADLSTRIDGADARIQEVNDKVVHLSYFKATFTLAVGEYGYKTDTKKIRYNNGNGVVDVPFYEGAVYRYGNNLYYWDASASEMTLFFRGIVADVATLDDAMEKVGSTSTIFELSSLITSTGDNYGKPSSTTYTNRARSKDFVNAPFKFSTPSGYRVYYVFAYDLNAVLNTSNAVSSRNYSSVSVKNINIQDTTKKYRILIAKDDDTQDVDVDVINTQSKFASGLFLDEGGIGFGKYYGCTNYPSHFTTYASLISAYDALVSKYPDLITKTALGVDGQGVSIYEYTIKSRTYNSEGNRGTLDSVGDKPLIALMAGVHGGERSTINGLYFLVRDILEGVAPVSTILGNINLRIIPCVCPYGFDNQSRTNANGVNINRNFDADWVYQDYGTNNYSGPSAASELETQIAQAWLQDVHADGAVLAIDWHNSGYASEISCLCTKSNAIAGTMDVKKSYLFSAYAIVNVLRSCYKVPDTANWGYTSVSGGAGYSNTYMDKIGQLGCYFETSNDVDGAGTYTLVTDACNASVMGNVLIGLGELFGIS